MNPQSEQELQRRLQKLEAELNNSSPVVVPEVQSSKQSPTDPVSAFKTKLTQVKDWFNGLPGTAKVVVGVVGFAIAFSVLQAVFKLVTAAISLAVLAGLVYVGYKFFVSPNTQK